jgi:hypothetical protein
MKLKTRKEDLKCCRVCKTPFSQDISMKGLEPQEGASNVHLNSECGWWVRIDFKYKFLEHETLEEEVVGEILCPTCHADHDKKMKEFIDSI